MYRPLKYLLPTLVLFLGANLLIASVSTVSSAKPRKSKKGTGLFGMPFGKRAECRKDKDCNDGNVCNGVEKCSKGKCTTTKPLVCKDRLKCTKDTCVPGRGCVFVPPDKDRDGHGDAKCGGDDCDDRDPNRYPGNTEVCDSRSHDEDCDPNTFGFKDADGDGFVSSSCCNKSGRKTKCGNDCADKKPNVHPYQAESCNGRDDNCNGKVDEGVKTRGYRDADGDLFGNPKKSKLMCIQKFKSAWVQNDRDCDDSDVKKNPISGCD